MSGTLGHGFGGEHGYSLRWRRLGLATVPAAQLLAGLPAAGGWKRYVRPVSAGIQSRLIVLRGKLRGRKEQVEALHRDHQSVACFCYLDGPLEENRQRGALAEPA